MLTELIRLKRKTLHAVSNRIEALRGPVQTPKVS